MYACLVMPSLIVGTVGGGTGLATQKECLRLMGCHGTVSHRGKRGGEQGANGWWGEREEGNRGLTGGGGKRGGEQAANRGWGERGREQGADGRSVFWLHLCVHTIDNWSYFYRVMLVDWQRLL